MLSVSSFWHCNSQLRCDVQRGDSTNRSNIQRRKKGKSTRVYLCQIGVSAALFKLPTQIHFFGEYPD